MDIKYLKSVVIYILSAVISILFIAYIVYHMTGSGNSNVTTVTATKAAAEETVTLDAYIMRKEKILYAKSGGSLYCLYPDGMKVPQDTEVLRIYSENLELQFKLAEIDRKIDILKSSNFSAGSNYSTDVIDSNIKSLYYSILKNTDEGDLTYTEMNKDDLLVQLNRKKISVSTVKNFDDSITALENTKKQLIASFGNINEKVKTDVSGNFYKNVDGYENIFSSDKAPTMTISDFNSMISSDAEDSILHSTSGNAVAKIVTDSYWYICCKAPNDEIRDLETGKEYTVVFTYNGVEKIVMKLDRVITEYGNDSSVLIFGTRTTPESFNFLRVQTVKVICKTTTGYKVPTGAVRYIDGNAGVYTLDVNKVTFKKINIITENDGYYVVKENDGDKEMLDLYEAIITSGKNLYEGKYIE